MMNKNRFQELAGIKVTNSLLLKEVNEAVRKSAMIHEEFKANSDSRDFDTFFREHRSLLVRAIRKYPNQLNESELESFDRIVNKSRKIMNNAGVLREWRSVVSLKKPEDFLSISSDNIMLEAYYGSQYQTLLTEVDTERSVKGINLKPDQLAGINTAMKSQIDAIKSLRTWYDALPADKKTDIDGKCREQSKSGKSFEDEVGDLEDEINGAYGVLNRDKFGTMQRAAKYGFGFFQRGMSKLFGAGETTQRSVEEDIDYDFNDILLEQEMSAVDQKILPALSQWYAAHGQGGNATMDMPTINRFARQFATSPEKIGELAHTRLNGAIPDRLTHAITNYVAPPLGGAGPSGVGAGLGGAGPSGVGAGLGGAGPSGVGPGYVDTRTPIAAPGYVDNMTHAPAASGPTYSATNPGYTISPPSAPSGAGLIPSPGVDAAGAISGIKPPSIGGSAWSAADTAAKLKAPGAGGSAWTAADTAAKLKGTGGAAAVGGGGASHGAFIDGVWNAGAKGLAMAGTAAKGAVAAVGGAGPAIAVAAGVAALVGAGAAGVKLGRRRKRIEKLQLIAKDAGGAAAIRPMPPSPAERVTPPPMPSGGGGGGMSGGGGGMSGGGGGYGGGGSTGNITNVNIGSGTAGGGAGASSLDSVDSMSQYERKQLGIRAIQMMSSEERTELVDRLKEPIWRGYDIMGENTVNSYSLAELTGRLKG
jgi:hypothetical protein